MPEQSPTTAEYAAACWELGLRPEWEDPSVAGTFRLQYDGACWLRECRNSRLWRWHAGLTDHEAACLLERAMRDELSETCPTERAALLAALRALQEAKP